MFGILTYSIFVISALIAILLRNQVLLLKGRSFLEFNLLFATIAILVTAVNGRIVENFIMIGFLGVVLAISLLLMKKWLLFRYDPSIVSGIIEESSSRILMPFEKSEQGYILGKDASNRALLRIVVILPKFAIISFKSRGRIKKVEVLRDLLNKRFNGIFPRPVIRL